MTYPSNSQSVAHDQIRAFVERVERMHEERRAIADDIKEIYAEAKGNGFDTKALKIVVQKRAMDTDKRLELEALVELYESALGTGRAPREADDETRAPARARENIEEFGEGRVQAVASEGLEGHVQPEGAETVGSNPALRSNQSTAALKEVRATIPGMATAINPATAGLHAADVVGIEQQADTQAPPVDTHLRNSKGIRKPEGCEHLERCRVAGWKERCFTCEAAFVKAHADAEGQMA